MKISYRWVSIAILSGLLPWVTSTAVTAGQEKGGGTDRGGKASTHTSSKGAGNSNAQWSADPEKGWVRADERHSTDKLKKNTGKPKDQNTKGGANRGSIN